MLDSFELNKIAGALLSATLFIIGLGALSDWLFDAHPPEKPGYAVAINEKQDTKQAEVAPAIPLGQMLASADVQKGQRIAKQKCASCHSFEKGGKNKIGPNLYGIANRPIAASEGFSYSSNMRKMEGTWTWKSLNSFMRSPKKFVPRTKMTFAGLSKDAERADLLAYLKSISPNAPDFPDE